MTKEHLERLMEEKSRPRRRQSLAQEMDEDLKPREIQIMDFVEEFTSDKGYPPTVMEIATGIGYKTKSHVSDMLNELKKEGYVTFASMKCRTIVLTSKWYQWLLDNGVN